MKLHVFNMPIYNVQVQIHPTRKSLEKYCKNATGDDTWGACVCTATAEDGSPFFTLSFRDHTYMRPEVIAHECVHLAWRILQTTGVKVSANNHEQLAYMVGYFVDIVTDYTTKCLKKKGKKK